MPEISIDRLGFVPYHEQIVAQVRTAIASKKLCPGQCFYSEYELAQKLGISKMPIRHAFQRLRTEGLLITSKGKRPVVGSGAQPWDVQQLWSFTEEIRHRGLIPSSRVLKMDLSSAGPETAEPLNLREGEKVYTLKRLRHIQGNPVALETTHLPAVLFPHLEEQDLEGRSLYEIIEKVYGRRLDTLEEKIGAITAETDEARLLQVRTGFPLLTAQRRVLDSTGTPVEFGFSLFRADQYLAKVISLRRI